MSILESKHQEQQREALQQFSSQEKIHIFRQLFRGREDVFPKRWDNRKTGRSGYSPACSNEWVRGICEKPRIKCTECPNQGFIKVSDDVIRQHLTGKDAQNNDATIGVYPLLPDETCWFLAADFDKEYWQKDIAAFMKTCSNKAVPAYVERSRSGNGGHVWIFFSSPVAASDARKMGSYLLTETMEHHPDLGFSSYDRFFPNQDNMPAGGFGNLIALPLQRDPRQQGNSVFLDENFEPYPDQWSFLSAVRKMTSQEVEMHVLEAIGRGRVTGLHIPVDDEDADEPWKARPSGKPRPLEITTPIPDAIKLVAGNQLYIEKNRLPPQLINRLIRTAAFQNPEFYKAQAMRLPIFDKPRIIACAENFPNHIGLPRGCLDDVLELLAEINITHKIVDERNAGKAIRTKFLGTLSKDQKSAVKALLAHDTGVLSATTGFGKTVLAAHIIAKRKRNTMILVHRKQLLEQWVARLQTFLDLEHINVGQIGGGKRKPTGQIDIALIQSLVRKGEVDDCVADYGQLIVDECHHLSAVSFEAVARQSKAKYVLGLTATPIRKDGQQPIIFMQCGPIRHHVDAKKQAKKRPFSHFVVPRYTEFRLPLSLTEQYERPPIQTVYAELANNSARNEMIVSDVVSALKDGRSPIILTERKEHVAFFADCLSGFSKHIITLQGGMGKKAHKQMLEEFESIGDHEERILIATGRYIGEGFDDARLDALFLAMPISWKGTLAQYAGRLHRIHHNKTKVQVYDYIDHQVPVLQRMSEKRMSGYRSLGYEIQSTGIARSSNILPGL
ncbi:TOTE conflict system archaeo-eukaryotic primase domain-containing protein [Nitrosomonas marina]|uniref:TOTE conflict system archaeo-eukaryotic primase domain-containing protein n=1 Tax=Nitrosomonas marina TaxID=917 RepID=UPI001C43604A|nr:DEAD/DEAH box helicase [Nitrosomonas marina]